MTKRGGVSKMSGAVTMLCRRFPVSVILCAAVVLTGLAQPSNEITVSAAISLKNAFEEISRLYEARTHSKVLLNCGASGDLMRQIAGGAPVDVFAPAAQKEMDELEKQGLIDTISRVNFAANTVVLIVPAGTKSSIRSFENLADVEVTRIAAGNPKTVPAGRYAEEIFRFYHVLSTIRDKLIYTENVRQTLDYVARAEVDAGVVYATDAAAGSTDTQVVAIAPEASHQPVVYPIALVKATNKIADARAFIFLVLSTEGKSILQRHGFTIAK